MRIHRAAWVVPIATPPVKDGWVAIHGERIVALGGPDDRWPEGTTQEWPGRAIMPGLVNAHTHLEFSCLRGEIPPAPTMPEWASTVIARRPALQPDAIAAAILEARACGTALVGDVTNTLVTYEPLLDSELAGCVFYELLGFNIQDWVARLADASARLNALTPVAWLRCSIVPHAPYSVAPAFMRAIADASRERLIAIHLAESAEELEFLRSGTGAWRRVLEQVGAWNAAWSPPAVGPVAYLRELGLLTDRLLAVHGVQLTDGELRELASAGATLVTCPRSNRWTGAGTPPIDRFYASGVRVAVGTDSLASVDDLNVFSELATIRAIAPHVPARRILASATRDGAAALGFVEEFGTIEADKRAEVIAVEVPDGVEDVEEYLVRGIPPSAIRWVTWGSW